MSEPQFLCRSHELPEGGSKGFDLQDGRQIFALRKRGRLYLYLNRCPHLGLPLNWLPDQFLDPERELIQCSSHGALFRIDNGHCVAGPCPGQRLQPLPVLESEDGIYLDSGAAGEAAGKR